MNYRATIGHHAAYKESGHVEKRELLLFDCANSYVLQMYIVLGRIQNRRRILLQENNSFSSISL